MAKAKKEVAKKEETGLALYQGLEGHEGQDDFSREDLAIPFLRVLQKMSPQCDEDQGEFIPGAKPGMIINTATNELYSGDEGVLVVPVKYARNYTEWVPRKEGGGLVADYGTDPKEFEKAELSDDGRVRVNVKGNELVDSAFYYVIRVDKDGNPIEQAIISMTSTQWKVARQWNTTIKSAQLEKPDGSIITNPPIYAFMYRLTTHRQENDQGSWYGWRVTRWSPVPEVPNGGPLLESARAMREAVDSGSVKPRYEENEDIDEDSGF